MSDIKSSSILKINTSGDLNIAASLLSNNYGPGSNAYGISSELQNLGAPSSVYDKDAETIIEAKKYCNHSQNKRKWNRFWYLYEFYRVR